MRLGPVRALPLRGVPGPAGVRCVVGVAIHLLAHFRSKEAAVQIRLRSTGYYGWPWRAESQHTAGSGRALPLALESSETSVFPVFCSYNELS